MGGRRREGKGKVKGRSKVISETSRGRKLKFGTLVGIYAF